MKFHPEHYNLSPEALRESVRPLTEHATYTLGIWAKSTEDEPYWLWVIAKLQEEVKHLQQITQTFKLDSTAKVAVDVNYHWQPMDTCPKGCKVQLLSSGGVATYGIVGSVVDNWWKGWAPLPTNKKD